MVAQRVSDTSGWLTRGSQIPQGGSQRLKTWGWLSVSQNTSGWLTKYLRHLSDSQRLSDTSRWLTEALGHLKVCQTPQGGPRNLSRHLMVVNRGSQIPQGGSHRLPDTSWWLRGSQTSNGCSQSPSDRT